MTQVPKHRHLDNPQPPLRCDVRENDIQDAAMALQIVRRLTQQYPAKHYPVIDNQLTAIHECLRAYCMAHSAPLPDEPMPAETSPGAENALDTGGKRRRVHCSICRDERRKGIDMALQSGMSLRRVASQFQLTKSTLNRHRRHGEIEP